MLGGVTAGPLERVDAAGEGPEYQASDSAVAGLLRGDEEYDPETAFADDDGVPAASAAAALDWAAIKAAAAEVAAEERQGTHAMPLEPVDTLDASAKQFKDGEEVKRRHKKAHASPLELPSPHEARSWPGSNATHAINTSHNCLPHVPWLQPAEQPLPSPGEPGSPHSLRHLLLSAVDPACLFGKSAALSCALG